ncbi:MAG: glycerophosphodiester phosphodiesterase [Pseudomonadota bacterium]|nr:glycerophosphodiester phosphodiesterase [Pseudomonadota bacterium]
MTIVIAHRGASGYLPEHTLSAVAYAYALGADFIEQDIVLSKDAHPVVLHDIHLDQVTNVKEKFPSRSRADGRWYARDFDLLELKSLRVNERVQLDGSGAVFPTRFPHDQGVFDIPTLQEEIDLIKGLNQSTGRNVGIYPEIKKPGWHMQEGVDISKVVLEVLNKNDYNSATDNIFLQCFDSTELKRIKNKLNSSLPLIQLIGNNAWNESDDDYDLMLTRQGTKNISSYAVGVGPYLQLLYQTSVANNKIQPTVFNQFVRENNLLIHPYTFREDAVPLAFEDFSEMVNWFSKVLNVDGMFTDFVDKTARLLK